MSRRLRVLFGDRLAGLLVETPTGGVRFQYAPEWLADPEAQAVSLRLPLREESWEWARPHPFFLGLLPEGWLFDVAVAARKLARDDTFGLLSVLCRDCPGAVRLVPEEETS